MRSTPSIHAASQPRTHGNARTSAFGAAFWVGVAYLIGALA